MEKEILGSLELNRIYQMDCIEGMCLIPDKSIDLILLDPPYNIGKDTWDKWKTVDDYIEFMGRVFIESVRILKENGSFYFFHSDMIQIAKLINWIDENTDLVYKQTLVWDKYNGTPQSHPYKGALWKQVNTGGRRNYGNAKEFCLFYTLQGDSFEYEKDRYELQDYTKYMNDIKTNLCLDLKKLNKDFGYVAGASWWFSKRQPRFINEEDYLRLRKMYPDFYKEYDELQELINKRKREFESKRYVFNQPENNISVLNFPIPDKQERVAHKTQKSLSLIKHLINTSSRNGDIVLDCFGGSGTTAVASSILKRKFIVFEKEQKYIEIANTRLDNLVSE